MHCVYFECTLDLVFLTNFNVSRTICSICFVYGLWVGPLSPYKKATKSSRNVEICQKQSLMYSVFRECAACNPKDIVSTFMPPTSKKSYKVFSLQDLEVSSNPYIAAILIGLIRLIGAFLGTLLLKKYPRKVLMMSSAALMAVCLGLLAATIYYRKSLEERFGAQIVDILPLIEMILYILFFGLGVGTVPWLLMGELCPVKVKGNFVKLWYIFIVVCFLE